MKRAFITGGSGFIGAHLIAALRQRGVEVVALARSENSAVKLQGLGATTVMGDLSTPSAFLPVLQGSDTVFHMAAPRRVADPATGQSSRPGLSDLLSGTRSLLDQLDQGAIGRFIVTSSASVYGRPWGVVDETALTRPHSAYGRYRVEVEALCRDKFAGAPQKLVIVRLTEVFGPGGVGHHKLFEEIAQEQFRLIGDGRALHHISAVEDVVAGLIACAETPEAGGRTLHIGSKPRKIGEIVAAVAAAAGRPVRSTPWLQPAAEAATKTLHGFSTLARAMPRLYSTLDYQIRPRAFDMAASRACLGDYASADFAEAVAQVVRPLRAPAAQLSS